MVIGITVSEFFGQLADAIMMALAAGTFIYVGATEVIAEEFENPEDKWKKFLSLSGICCINNKRWLDVGLGWSGYQRNRTRTAE